jgi:hypothetical protein
MDCTQIIEGTIKELKLGFKCIPSDRFLTIVTPYLYPDNDLIEVFVEEIDDNILRVTDLGETLRHLESMGLDLFASRKRKFLLDQIAQRTHVILERGKLQKEGSTEEIGATMLDVIAASHSVASLMYTSKAYEPTIFNDEVSEYLTENSIKHQKDYPVVGLSGKKYRVNIQVNSNRPKELLIETLSPSQEYAITATINRVIRLWFDIEGHREKVSLLNDVDFTWRNEDIALLGRASFIQYWSKKEQFLTLVKGKV